MIPTDKYVVMHGNIVCHNGTKDECYEWLRLRDERNKLSTHVVDYTTFTAGRQWIVGRADLLVNEKSLIDIA